MQAIFMCISSGYLQKSTAKKLFFQLQKNFDIMLQDIHIRSHFAAGDQIMFVYDMLVPAPIDQFRAAALMEFTDQLISKIELFYDARFFAEKKNDIFSQ